MGPVSPIMDEVEMAPMIHEAVILEVSICFVPSLPWAKVTAIYIFANWFVYHKGMASSLLQTVQKFSLDSICCAQNIP